jgi:protein CpxP
MRFNKTKTTYGILALVVLLAAVVIAGFAQHGPGADGRQFGGRGRGGPMGHQGLGLPLRGLNLTEEQKTKVQQLTEAFEANTKAQRDQLHTLGGKDLDAVVDGTFNEAQVRADAQARANVMIELDVARARLMSEIYGLLTPEQKTQLAQKRQEMQQRRQEWEARRQASKPGEQN